MVDRTSRMARLRWWKANISLLLDYYGRCFWKPSAQIHRYTILFVVFSYVICLFVLLPRVLLWYPKAAIEALISGTISTILLLFCLVAVRCVDPGSVVPLPEPAALADGVSQTVCPHCNTVHRPRTRFCAGCALCVTRRDHHCQIFDLCVGVENYRWFISVLILAACVSSIAAKLSYHFTMACIDTFTWLHWRSISAVLTFAMFIYAALIVVSYLTIHMILFVNERTMAEWLSKKEKKDVDWSAYDRNKPARLIAETAVLIMAPIHTLPIERIERIRRKMESEKTVNDETEET